MVGHRRREAHEHFGVGDKGRDVVMMADDVDGELREAFEQHHLVARLHRFLDFAENQNVCHTAFVSRDPENQKPVFGADRAPV
jgi:hypothetical protein